MVVINVVNEVQMFPYDCTIVFFVADGNAIVIIYYNGSCNLLPCSKLLLVLW